MTVNDELLTKALRLQGDLESLRQNMETGSYRPETKSAMARDICESQARVQAIIQACTLSAV